MSYYKILTHQHCIDRDGESLEKDSLSVYSLLTLKEEYTVGFYCFALNNLGEEFNADWRTDDGYSTDLDDDYDYPIFSTTFIVKEITETEYLELSLVVELNSEALVNF